MKRRKGGIAHLRSRFVSRFVAILLVFGIVTISTDVRVLGEGSAQNIFSGEQIFRGIVFGQGEVAGLFPEIWRDSAMAAQINTENRKRILNEFADYVVSDIKANDPNFLTYFGQEIQSGDHIRIKEVLDATNLRLHRALQNSKRFGDAFASNVDDPEAADYKVVVTVVVAYEMAAVVSVVAVVGAAIYVSEFTNPEKPSLLRDQFIGMVADRLRSS